MPGVQAFTIIIMAKAPEQGRAKTRMIPALGETGAARLARQLLEHTVGAALASGAGAVEICATPPIDNEAWQGIQWPAGLVFSDQGDGDLGKRMASASQRVLSTGQGVLLIGTDCAQMSPELLRQAARQLRETDAVIYPTRDGGYALLGLRHYHSSVFRDIPWSTDQVYSLTQQRLEALNGSLVVGDILQDLDEPEDLRYWPSR